MFTITFCQCALCNSVTCRTLSFLSERRYIYRVFCTRLQFFFRDRCIPRRFRFHQHKIIFERGVIISCSLTMHLNRKDKTNHSIRSRSPSTTFTLHTYKPFHMTSGPLCWCQNTNTTARALPVLQPLHALV